MSSNVPAAARKVVQSLKEVVNRPEAEIYATLKDCNMDPNEAVNRLLSQDPFREVKSKREKKKEGKDSSESRSRGANTNRGSKSGADRQPSRGGSAPYIASESLYGKSTYKKENGSDPHTTSLSSAPVMSGHNRSRGNPGLSDGATAESKGFSLGAVDGMTSVVQPASEYQSAWSGVPGQVSMADIVRMGRPHKQASNAPNASHHNIKDSSTDHAPIHPSDHVPTTDEWPSIERPPVAAVISVPDYTVDSELHPEAPGASFDSINRYSEAEEVRKREDDYVEDSEGSDVSNSSWKNPEDDSRFENELHKNTAGYQSEAHDFERHEDVHDFDGHEDEEVGASVPSVTRSLQHLTIEKDDRGFSSEEDTPSVVIPDHLQVQAADCSHLSFGSFGSGMTYSSGLVKSNSEEEHIAADTTPADQLETRQPEYYIDDSLRNTPDATMFHRNGASGESYDASSASQTEDLRPNSAEVTHANQYPFPSSNPGYTFDEARRLNAAINETSSEMQKLAQFSQVMHSYTNSQPSTHPAREVELQYSPFPVAQSMSAKYGNSVSTVGGSAMPIPEDLKTAGLPPTQPAPHPLSGPSVATGPPLPQQLAVHPYSQSALPLGPFSNMIGYPLLPQSYTYMPSAFQQVYPGGSTYHQSLAALLPQYKSSDSVSSLPQSAPVASGYGAFGSNTAVPGNYSMNLPAAPSGTNLSYDDVLAQYKEASHLLSLQQNENWRQGPNSRTMPAVQASAYYNYQAQNQQQPGGSRQGQQQAQNYGGPGYTNFYHSPAGMSLSQQQNPRDGSLGGPQGQIKQSPIWPNNY